MYNEYKQPTEQNKAQYKQYAADVASKPVGGARILIITAIVIIVSIAIFVLSQAV